MNKSFLFLLGYFFLNLFLSRYPSLNQIIIKGFVPLVFGLMVFQNRYFRPVWLSSEFGSYIIFFCWGALGLATAYYPSATLDYLQILLGIILIWYTVFSLSIRASDEKTVFLAFFIVSSLHLFYSLFYSGGATVSTGSSRLSSLIDNANGLAFVFLYGIFSAFFVFRKGKYERIILLLFVGVFLYGIIETASRKTFIAFLVFASFLTILSFNRRNLGLIIFLAFTFYVAFDLVADYIFEETLLGSRLDESMLERGASVRIRLFFEGVSFFKEHPIFGIGLGNFSKLSRSGAFAHNDLIEVASTTGLVGLFLYSLLYVFLLRKALRIRTSIQNRLDRQSVNLLISFIFTLLFLGIGRPTFLDFFAMHFIAAISGVLYSLDRKPYSS